MPGVRLSDWRLRFRPLFRLETQAGWWVAVNGSGAAEASYTPLANGSGTFALADLEVAVLAPGRQLVLWRGDRLAAVGPLAGEV